MPIWQVFRFLLTSTSGGRWSPQIASRYVARESTLEVAGIGFEIRCTDRQRQTARGLLSFAQRLLDRHYALELRYRWADGEYRVTVDGALPGMQVSTSKVFSALPVFAAGMRSDLSQSERARVADRITSTYSREVEAMSAMVLDLADLAKEHGVSATHFSLEFRVGRFTHLAGAAEEFSIVLSQYHDGEISPSRFAEQAHTFAELLLKASVNVRGDSFGQLVSRARQQGFLETDGSDLLELKDLRRESKHRGKNLKHEEIDPLVLRLVRTFHYLLERMNE